MTAVATLSLKHPVVQLLNKPEAMQMLQAMLPQGVTAAAVISETYYAIQKNAEIAECTPASIVRAVSLAAKTGLIIGETVHLVPFNVKVTAKGQSDRWEKRLEKINDYKGDIELVTRTGAARSVMAKCVYQNEIDKGRFDYIEGTVTDIKHRPILIPSERGAMAGAYARAIVSPNMPPTVVWVSLEEIEAIRKKSKQWSSDKIPQCPPWYAKKTAVKQLVKFLSRNSRVADLFDHDEGPVAVVEGEEVQFVGVATREDDARRVLDDDSGDLRFPGEPGFQDDRELED